MSAIRGYLASRHSTQCTPVYTPYFRKPLWACSPDADTLAPPIFDTRNKMISSANVSDQKALGTTGMEDPFARSRGTRSFVDDNAHLVQATAAYQLAHDATACTFITELEKQSLISFAAPSFSRVAPGSSVSSSSGSVASTSLSDMVIPSQRLSATTHTRDLCDDIAARKSVPVVPPGLGYDIPLSSLARLRGSSQIPAFGVIGDRSSAEGHLAQRGLDRVVSVTPPVIPELQGSCAIPSVTPKSLELKGIAYAFSHLSAHFMYSLAIQAGAEDFFPDP